MDLNNFTEKLREALADARTIGTHLQHQVVDAEHLMFALLEEEGDLVRSLFEKNRVAPDLLKGKLREELDRIPRISSDTTTGQRINITQRLNKLLVQVQAVVRVLVSDAGRTLKIHEGRSSELIGFSKEALATLA